jgi:hypothetical protein
LLTRWQKYQKQWLENELCSLSKALQILSRQKNEGSNEEKNQVEEKEISVNKNIRIYLTELTEYFPPKEDPYILPTRLGNTTAAFEAYPYQKYNLDGVSLWTRMVPILIAKKYMSLVEREKNLVDFFLYLSFVCAVFALEYTLLNLAYVKEFNFALLCFQAILSYFFYRCAVKCTSYWGETFKTAFDLYRNDLRKALRIRPFRNFHDERFVWEKMSVFVTHCKNITLAKSGTIFDYSSEQKNEENEQ